MQKEVKQWITVHGIHVPLFEGETVKDAVSRMKNNKTAGPKNKDSKVSGTKKTINNHRAYKFESETPNNFNKSINSARESRPLKDKWRVDVHTADEYVDKGCKCYKSDGGSTVAVTSDGDVISVCKHKNDKAVSGKALLSEAVKMGGKKLDSFAGNNSFYVSCGFEPIAHTPFNKKYAPDGWTASGCGEESVVFYKYVGVGKVKNTDWTKTKKFVGDDGYDNAYAYRDEYLKKGEH